MSTTTASSVISSDILAAHLQDIIVEYESYRKQFRRNEARESVSIPVEATELDGDFNPTSQCFHMVTRDMSVHGTGMFHNQKISSNYLRLQFSSPVSQQTFTVNAKVEHCTPCGKYYIVGCRFITNRESD
jgi:hypothetical protein